MTVELDAAAELRRLARDLATAAERLDSLASSLTAHRGQAAERPEGAVDNPPAPRLYTVPEVMEHLSLGRATVYNLIRTGDLASLKIGNSRRVTQQALRSYIASC